MAIEYPFNLICFVINHHISLNLMPSVSHRTRIINNIMSRMAVASLDLLVEASLEAHALEHVQVLFFPRGFGDVGRAPPHCSVCPFHQKGSDKETAQKELRNLPIERLFLLLLVFGASLFPVLAIEVSIGGSSCAFLRRQRPRIFLALIFC